MCLTFALDGALEVDVEDDTDRGVDAEELAVLPVGIVIVNSASRTSVFTIGFEGGATARMKLSQMALPTKQTI